MTDTVSPAWRKRMSRLRSFFACDHPMIRDLPFAFTGGSHHGFPFFARPTTSDLGGLKGGNGQVRRVVGTPRFTFLCRVIMAHVTWLTHRLSTGWNLGAGANPSPWGAWRRYPRRYGREGTHMAPRSLLVCMIVPAPGFVAKATLPWLHEELWLMVSLAAGQARIMAMVGMASQQPVVFAQNYARLEEWGSCCLERHKAELKGALFPLFVLCYFKLVALESEEALPFLSRWGPEHSLNYGAEVANLAAVTTAADLKADRWASLVLAQDPVSFGAWRPHVSVQRLFFFTELLRVAGDEGTRSVLCAHGCRLVGTFALIFGHVGSACSWGAAQRSRRHCRRGPPAPRRHASGHSAPRPGARPSQLCLERPDVQAH